MSSLTVVQSAASTDLDASDLPHVVVNRVQSIALDFGDFAACVIRDNAHAAANGLRVIDAYVNPDGREGDGSAKVKTYPTDARMADYAPMLAKLRTLCTLAGRVRSDLDAVAIVERSALATLAAMANVDRDLFAAWVRSEKAHLDGPTAAVLDVDGFGWAQGKGAVDKGHSVRVREDETAQRYSQRNRSDLPYMERNGYLSERDMADLSGLHSED